MTFDRLNQNNMDVTPNQVKAVGMNFSTALNLLKEGLLIQRSGWNGKGMFLFIRPEWSADEESFLMIKSVPQNVKDKIYERFKDAGMKDAPIIKFTAYISMFAADGSIVNGWLASQTDLLAEDWQIVE